MGRIQKKGERGKGILDGHWDIRCFQGEKSVFVKDGWEAHMWIRSGMSEIYSLRNIDDKDGGEYVFKEFREKQDVEVRKQKELRPCLRDCFFRSEIVFFF